MTNFKVTAKLEGKGINNWPHDENNVVTMNCRCKDEKNARIAVKDYCRNTSCKVVEFIKIEGAV